MFNDAKNDITQPDLIAYHVPDRVRGRKQYWQRIGVVFFHKNNDGADVLLDAIPVGFTGRIVLRKPKEQDDQETGEVLE